MVFCLFVFVWFGWLVLLFLFCIVSVLGGGLSKAVTPNNSHRNTYQRRSEREFPEIWVSISPVMQVCLVTL